MSEHEDLGALQAEIDDVGRGVARRIEPGVRAMVLSVAVLVLLVSVLLPWIGSTNGWQVLVGQPTEGVTVGAVPRLFVCLALGFGVLATAVALGLRRWAGAWVCALGGGFTCVIGLLTIWSLQSSASHQPGPGPGAGLVLTVLTMLVLTVTWVRLAFSRS